MVRTLSFVAVLCLGSASSSHSEKFSGAVNNSMDISQTSFLTAREEASPFESGPQGPTFDTTGMTVDSPMTDPAGVTGVPVTGLSSDSLTGMDSKDDVTTSADPSKLLEGEGLAPEAPIETETPSSHQPTPEQEKVVSDLFARISALFIAVHKRMN